MSKSKRDAVGGHPWKGYSKENWVHKFWTKRKRRRAGKRYIDDYENEDKIPPPDKSTGGWLTW